MGRKGDYKHYRKGDQIHISVTKDFAEIATQFFKYCREHHFNPSDVMRGAINDWLSKQKEMQRIYKNVQMERGDVIEKMVETYERSVLYGEEEG
jgi:hypothetical protein